MHGPGLSYYAPRFDGEPIVVQDGVALSLGTNRRRRWTKALERAIVMWSPAVAMRLVIGDTLTFIGLGSPDWPDVTSEVAGFSKPGHITLVRSRYEAVEPKFYPMAWAFQYAAFFDPPRIMKQTDAFYQLDRTIAHELGHTLGLAHGGNGIMSGGMGPNAHDLDSVHNYYYSTA